ncbi:MAG: hypothetical protein AABX70_00310 [Nanoarchaeota archaeon]
MVNAWTIQNDKILQLANRRTTQEAGREARVRSGAAGIDLIQPSSDVRSRFSDQVHERGTWADLLLSVVSQDEYGAWIKNLPGLKTSIEEGIARLEKDFFDSEASSLLNTTFDVKKVIANQVHRYFQHALLEIRIWKLVLSCMEKLQRLIIDYLEAYQEAANTTPLQDIDLSRLNVQDPKMAAPISKIKAAIKLIKTIQENETKAMTENLIATWENFVERIASFTQLQASTA